MEKKIFQILYILRNFSPRKKIVFFVLAAIFMVGLLSVFWKVSLYYSAEIPAGGGSFSEGIIGTPRFINPLLAISDADKDLVSLIYSGLMRPDNKDGLVPDLAERYEISPDGLVYTFVLKNNLVWPDSEKITSDDILFTVQQAKDPQLKSSKRANWEGVRAEKIDDRTVRFILSKPYTPFLESATLGVLPKHLWKNAVAEQMSFSEFNTEPVGSGPYKIKNINRNSSGIAVSYELEHNNNFALSKPFINKVTLYFYSSETDLLNAFQRGEIDAAGAIAPSSLEKIKRNDVIIKTLSLPRIFGVFFNQNNNKVLIEKEVRQALNLSVDKKKIIDEVLLGFGTKLDYPIPPGVFGALELTSDVDGKTSDVELAKKLLPKNGWTFNKEDNIWEKTTGSGKKKQTTRLEFSLSTSDSPEMKQIGELLKNMWESFGARVELKIFETGDLNQNIIRARKYDSLLFGEVIGRDPDPFVFWHSSQRNDPGLNIAMYANKDADKILEEARNTVNETARKQKYEQFQKEVVKDTPAIFLFSPDFIYLLPNYLKGIEEIKSINSSPERFAQIYKWYIKTDRVWKIFAK